MRRQFADPELNPGEERVEKQVISYPGVYMRVVPELANCIVFMLAGKDMVRRRVARCTVLVRRAL